MDPLAALRHQPRLQVRRDGPPDPEGRCVVYWMQRAQRALDNPALDVAVEAGNALGLPVVVFLGLVPRYAGANLRHYRFLVDGLADLAAGLRGRRVGLVLRRFPDHGLEPFCHQVSPALVIGDENPLRQPERWRRVASERLRVPLWTVDADVVVPVHLLQKEQFAARTIRPRLHRLLPQFLVPGDDPVARVAWAPPPGLLSLPPESDLLDSLPGLDRSVSPVSGIRGGSAAAARALDRFLRGPLAGYDQRRNHPEEPGTSQLSPYLHFGHLGPRSVALAVTRAAAPEADRAAFLEQLIVRRELAINYCHFNRHYDTLDGCEAWARASLARHAADPRPVLLDEDRLHCADSGDPLWDAAQRQMLELGWMHNYLRMYWGKKILEWSPTPEQAFRVAVRLNDRYQLDGRDPNGYAGIAWSIGGKHDRPWFERPIFGSIRYMSLASTSRKFDSRAFIARWGARSAGQPSLFR